MACMFIIILWKMSNISLLHLFPVITLCPSSNLQAEVNYLGQLHHENLVTLIGYCVESDNRLLVYEFMTKGSLENHLFRSESISVFAEFL